MRISKSKLRLKLDQLYDRYNKKEFIDPDPLLFLYRYPDTGDREIAGMIASCLAYGRVSMIMKAVDAVLGSIGPSPRAFLLQVDGAGIKKRFKGFKYRFSTQDHLSALLLGIQAVILEYGSLEACFSNSGNFDNVAAGLGRLYTGVSGTGNVGHLMADPCKTSACKRSHLFLRWMVRKDDVDPGGWTSVSPAQLICPIDTHMYKIGRLLGFTRRKNADKRCATEITRGFAKINSHDPVKYDFALTRFGIREQVDIEDVKRFIQL